MAAAHPLGILITRPEPGATETARRVASLGLHPVLAPVLTIAPRPVRLPPSGRLQAILVTSGNAVAPLPAAYRDLRLLAVGDATAAQARAAGFADVHSAGRDAAALAGLAARLCSVHGLALLLACGEEQGTALAADLRGRGFLVHRRVVYAATAAAGLPEPALAALAAEGLRAALFFSPASARAFVRLLAQALPPAAVAGLEALAISAPTAAALAPLPWRRIRVASAPSQDELLSLLQ